MADILIRGMEMPKNCMVCADCGKAKFVQLAIPMPGAVTGIVEVMSE